MSNCSICEVLFFSLEMCNLKFSWLSCQCPVPFLIKLSQKTFFLDIRGPILTDVRVVLSSRTTPSVFFYFLDFTKLSVIIFSLTVLSLWYPEKWGRSSLVTTSRDNSNSVTQNKTLTVQSFQFQAVLCPSKLYIRLMSLPSGTLFRIIFPKLLKRFTERLMESLFFYFSNNLNPL